jgi:hypothetical protein
MGSPWREVTVDQRECRRRNVTRRVQTLCGVECAVRRIGRGRPARAAAQARNPFATLTGRVQPRRNPVAAIRRKERERQAAALLGEMSCVSAALALGAPAGTVTNAAVGRGARHVI